RELGPELLVITTRVLEHERTTASVDEAVAEALIKTAGDDPCALAVARAFAAEARTSLSNRERELDEAARAAERCGDDRMIFDIAAAAATLATLGLPSEIEVAAKLDRVEALSSSLAPGDTQLVIEL